MVDNTIYDKHAAQWWDDDGPFKMLHKMNPVRLSFLQQHTKTLVNMQALDVGCGGGIFACALAKAGAMVTGLDTSAESIQAATAHAKMHDLAITYKQQTLLEYAVTRQHHAPSVDLVCALELLEHVLDPEQICIQAASVLNTDGLFLVSTINRSMHSYLFGIIAAEYLLGWNKPGTHSYSSFVRPSELIGFARKRGLELVSLQGITFSTQTQSFSLSTDVRINYIALFKKI